MSTIDGKKKIFLSLIIFVLFFAAASILKVKAGVSENTSGWLGGWSDDGAGNSTGVGWISMNSSNCDTNGDGTIDNAACISAGASGGIANYGLSIPTSDGDFSGPGYYTWNPNISWVSFNPADLASCPAPPCTARRAANQLKGWARIMSIPQAGANAGGWQGWIKLSSEPGDSVAYGIILNADGTITKGQTTSYAWSNELGWIDFSGAMITPPNILKICMDNCDSGILIANGSNRAMTVGDSSSLKACFNTSASCDTASGDVTASPSVAWNDNNTPKDAVSLSGMNPKTLTANSEGSEGISVSYSSQTSSFTVTVSPLCLCNTNCEDSTCKGTDCNDSCGNPICPGTKDCEAKWREIAP